MHCVYECGVVIADTNAEVVADFSFSATSKLRLRAPSSSLRQRVPASRSNREARPMSKKNEKMFSMIVAGSIFETNWKETKSLAEEKGFRVTVAHFAVKQ